MPHDTFCHLRDGTLNGTPCPQGDNFAVKDLRQHGGNIVCTEPSCPHKIQQIRGDVTRVIQVGPPGREQKSLVINR